MKKLLFVMLTCIMSVNIGFAETRIIRIAPNNVEIQEVLYKDKAGKEEVIISRESYGQSRINQERANAQANLDAIDAMTAEEYKNKARKAFIDHKVKLDEIEKEIKKGE